MRIIAGTWRGRPLITPPGAVTRPTADRVRQALFDMLLHAPWGGRESVEGAHALDVFAGTGAFGLEALSRGAAHVTFVEHDRTALTALRANIAACRALDRSTILAIDALAVPPGAAASLVFLDPPVPARPGAARDRAIARGRPYRAWCPADRGNSSRGAAAHIGTAACRAQSRRSAAQHLASPAREIMYFTQRIGL